MLKVLADNKVGVIVEVEDDDNEDNGDGFGEPMRDMTNLLAFSMMPLDSETLPSALISSYITPTKDLYVRNHSLVPLSVSGSAASYPISIAGKLTTLGEISEKYPLVSLHCVLQCAGNRQQDDHDVNGDNIFTGTKYQEKSKSGQVGNIKVSRSRRKRSAKASRASSLRHSWRIIEVDSRDVTHTGVEQGINFLKFASLDLAAKNESVTAISHN